METGPDARDTVCFDAGWKVRGRKRDLLCETPGPMVCLDVQSASMRIATRFPFMKRFIADAAARRLARNFERFAASGPSLIELMSRRIAGFRTF